MVSDKIFSIKNVPVGCIILSVLAILGAISHPDAIWFAIFAITFTVGVVAFFAEKLVRKYEADKLVESEKIRLRQERERTKQKEKTQAQKMNAEALKTQRESMRNQRAEIKQKTTIIDNASKFLRGW
jgi:hypothetical protein